jgi:hypothetical protein
MEPDGHAATPELFPARCGVWRHGTRVRSCARGYLVYMVPTVAPRTTSGEAVNLQVGPILFPLRSFDDIST